MKKVIIIGSGLGGLSSGVVLAKNGYDVTVLEQESQAGGCLQCFCRHGVKFETGMHFVGSADEGQILNKMMRYLEIDDKLELSRLDTDCYHVVSLQGQQFGFANGKEAFISRMASYFPGQTDNLVRYCQLVESISAASSLHTLKYGATEIIACATHPVMSGPAIDRINATESLKRVIVTDTIPLGDKKDRCPKSQVVSVAALMAKTIHNIHTGSSVSVLFV